MTKLIDITGKAISGEWGNDDNAGTGILVLRTTNFTNEGVINYTNIVTRDISKKDLSQKYLQPGDSDKQPVDRVVYFDGEPTVILLATTQSTCMNVSIWQMRVLRHMLLPAIMQINSIAFEVTQITR